MAELNCGGGSVPKTQRVRARARARAMYRNKVCARGLGAPVTRIPLGPVLGTRPACRARRCCGVVLTQEAVLTPWLRI